MDKIKFSSEFKVGKNNIGFISSFFLEEFGKEKLGTGSVLPFQTLKRSMDDSEIISELGIKECTLSDVLATLKSAPKEIKDGYWNIFYIKGHSRVVYVGWDVSSWRVDTWVRGSYWDGGERVFSPANEILTPSSSPSESLTLPNELIVNSITYIKK